MLKNPTIPVTSLDQATKDILDNFGVGSCILNMVDKDFPIELVGWKGFSILKDYVNGECRLHYLRLLGVDVSEFGMLRNAKIVFLGDKYHRSDIGCIPVVECIYSLLSRSM